MKEIAEIIREFESKLWSWDRTRTNAHSTTTERPSRIDFARKILAHLKEKGWRSGEEVDEMELQINSLQNDVYVLMNPPEEMEELIPRKKYYKDTQALANRVCSLIDEITGRNEDDW
jgi:hypothetical protein